MKTVNNSKKGSTTVFLSVILSSLVMLSMAMIWSAEEHSINSRIDGIVDLAGDSLMSEFHKEIYTDYGLFFINGDGSKLSSGLRVYADPTVSAMKNVSLSHAAASGSRYAIVDPGPVKDQIISYMKSGGADLILGREKTDPRSGGYHNLNHGPTIVSLPSRQVPDKSLLDYIGLTDRLGGVSEIFTQGSEKYLMGSYVLGTFNNRTGLADTDHFFHNEVEYILCGKLTDAENEKAVTRLLEALRFPSNLSYIYTDTEKSAALTAAAEAVAPGPLGLALKGALACAWAWAESVNDAGLLMDGHKVPVVKTPGTWALDIETLLDSIAEGILDRDRFNVPEEDSSPETYEDELKELHDYEKDPDRMLKKNKPVIRPAEDRGLDYEQYLRILLFFKDEPQTVLRALDLIQINVRKDHDGAFLIGEQSTGISMEVKANGRNFQQDKTY